ncbi:MAG: BON domain-containing protein [Burkholderiaceae bacterium]
MTQDPLPDAFPAHSRHSRTPRSMPALAAAVLLALAAPAAIAADAPRGKAGTAKPAAKPAADTPCQAGEASFFRDEGLTMKLQTKLQFNRELLREQIQVKVNGGVATLYGGVSTPQHIALALDIARQVDGIRCVNNFLRVGPPDPPQQQPIN